MAELRDTTSQRVLAELPSGSEYPSPVFSPDHSRIFFGWKLYDGNTGKVLWNPPDDERPGTSEAWFSKDSRWCAVASIHGGLALEPSTMMLIDTKTGERLFNVRVPLLYETMGPEVSALFTPDENGLIVGNRRFDLTTRNWQDLKFPGNPVLPQGVSPDGRYIATAANKLLVIELESGKTLFEWPLASLVYHWSHDGALLWRDWIWRKDSGLTFLEGCENSKSNLRNHSHFLGAHHEKILREDVIYDSYSGKRLWNFKISSEFAWSRIAKGDHALFTRCSVTPEDFVLFARNNRPEPWWGVFYLPAFWLTLLLVPLSLWSLLKDWRTPLVTPAKQ